jgi:hypothetical protein
MAAMDNYPANALQEALKRLIDSTILPEATEHLQANAGAIDAELAESVLAAIPAFSESRNPDVLPELAMHGPEHTREMVRLLKGGEVGDFEFVRKHARRRAEQRFPLEATLHAYRCGHKVFSHWVREAILTAAPSATEAPQVVAAIADFTIEYTDAVSTVAASAYVAQTRLLADVAGDHRAELLNLLLEGYDESDGRVASILRDAGYLEGHQSFCIALARPVDVAEMQNPARARRLADSISGILRNSTTRRLVDIRDNKVTAVFSDARRASGWTVPHIALARRIAADSSMLSNSVLIGVSNDVPSTSQIPNAYREALLALELADVTNRVVQFSEIPARRLLLRLAGEEFQRTLPGWADKFTRADQKAGGILVATLRAYADANMNVLKTAESLSVHPNTIYARMQRIHDITDQDARSYHALTELLIVAECSSPPTTANGA